MLKIRRDPLINDFYCIFNKQTNKNVPCSGARIRLRFGSKTVKKVRNEPTPQKNKQTSKQIKNSERPFK